MSHEIPDFPSTTGVLRRLICPKFLFDRDYAPDPAGVVHDPPLVGWGGEGPLPFLAPRSRSSPLYGVSTSTPLAPRPVEFHFLEVGNIATNIVMFMTFVSQSVSQWYMSL